MSTYNDDFITDSVAEFVKPMPCISLRRGGHVIMQKNHPCKIMEIATSKPGKHGSAKAHITGIDIFSGKRHEEIFTTRSRVYVPAVSRSQHEVSFMNPDNVVHMFNADMSIRSDLSWTPACTTPLVEARAMLAAAEADSSCRLRVEAVLLGTMGMHVIKELRLKE